MSFSSSGTPVSMKEHSLGVSIGPGVPVGVSSAGYATFTTSSHNFQGGGEFSQPQREFLTQRNMMSQAAEQHPQGHGQSGGHSQGQHINMNEGAKVSTVSTHDFLSLYADNSNQYAEQHDNSRGLSSALTTKDFLQPLERGNHAAFREGQPSRVEKHPRQQDVLPHGSSAPPPAVVERLLSSGMGAYNGGHSVPNYGRVSKGGIDLPNNAMVRMVGEGNVEMRGRGGFNPSSGPMVPREEHDTRNDLPKDQDPPVRGDNLAYWSNVRLKFGMLPPELGFHPPNQAPSHGVMDNVQQPPVPNIPKQWPQGIQGVIDMTKRPIRVLSEDDEDDEEEYGDRPRETRKETFPKADPAQKPDGKAPETRGGTPRSKHSATEQRRRSKINDRFQMLRELVPHSDQKRDKASFLLEVIEYIQVLQDKVRKFEAAEHGRHQDRLKNMVWDLCKRSGSGPGDTSIEATCIDALAYAREYAPSAVTGVPVDVKSVAEATDAGRQRTVSNADENGNSEMLPHNAQHTHKTGHHGVNASHEEKEGGAGLGKPPLSSQHQGQTSHNSRNIPLSSQSKQLSAASDAQANLTTEGQGHNSSVSAPATGSYEERDKPNEVEPSQQTRTQSSSQQAQGEGNTTEQQHSDTRIRHGTSTAEDAGNGNASSLDDDQSKPHSKQDRQHGFGSSPRATHNSQTTDASHANWQGQQHGSSADNAQQREESRGAPSSQGQDPLPIQGGVINVSSVYSQGLLDTLTRALQSSGLDLSQANISVQIDLGRSISSASLPPSAPKASGHQSESSGQRHQQFEGPSRQQGGSCTDPEHPPLKRPKLEMEL